MRRSALILGASGQVGQALARDLESRGWDWQGSYHQHPEVSGKLFQLDLGDLGSIEREILSRAPGAVFLPSGFTWVDGCEDDPLKVRLINALAPEAAAKAAARLNIPLVFYSTDYVFGAEGGPYDELRAPSPLGVYGVSKLEGELRVQEAWPGSLVLRTNVVYGPEPQGKNFVYQLLKSLKQGKAMSCPVDQISSPTYNTDLARASIDLVEKGLNGLWNVAGPELMDRYSFARLAARIFELDASLLKPVRTSELQQRAARPLGAGLSIGKLKLALGWTPLSPEAGLTRMQEALEALHG
jgi:dTDP-4-dehydrorhamnose reductase